MGYETRLYIGQIYDNSPVEGNGCKWFSRMAMVDLCKCGDGPLGTLSTLSKKCTTYGIKSLVILK